MGPLYGDMGDINKPHGQLRGRGVGQINAHFITKALFSKSDHEGGEGSKIPKNLTTWFMDDPLYSKQYHYVVLRNLIIRLYNHLINEKMDLSLNK